MNRKHFLLTALTGLVATLLPKRGESAPMPHLDTRTSITLLSGDVKKVDDWQMLGCSGCGLVDTCKCAAINPSYYVLESEGLVHNGVRHPDGSFTEIRLCPAPAEAEISIVPDLVAR